MAQIKSQKKRIITDEKAHVANANAKAALRTAVKKTEKAVTDKKLDEAVILLNAAISLIDKAVSDDVEKQNTANRQKSHLNKLVDTIRPAKKE